MRNIKTLLRLLGAVSLSTVAASSVVACGGGDNDSTKLLNGKVSQNLKLTDTNGKGLRLPTINVDYTDKSKVTWKIDETSIKINELVKNDKKAKDKESFDFLKDILKIKIDSGTKLEDTIFNETELNAVIITISDINVDLKPNKINNDFYIANGSYNIMFTNGDTQTNKYKIVTKLMSKNDKNDFIYNIFPKQLTNIDFNSTFQNEFKIGQPVSKFQVGINLASKLGTTDNAKEILGFQKLIKINVNILVSKNDKTEGNFTTNDKIQVQFTFNEVKFHHFDLMVS